MTVCIVPHSDPQVSTMHLHVLALHITSITTFTMKFWWENAYCWFAVFFNYRSLEHSTHTYLGNLPTRIKGKNSYDLSIHTYLYYLYLFFCYVQLFFVMLLFEFVLFNYRFVGPKAKNDLIMNFEGPIRKRICAWINGTLLCHPRANLRRIYWHDFFKRTLLTILWRNQLF